MKSEEFIENEEAEELVEDEIPVTPGHERIYEAMKNLLCELQNREKSRENSVAITKLEEAMMWYNKDRAIKGELIRSSTHVK